MQKQYEIAEATIQGRERQKVTKRLKTGNISKVYASAKALHKYHTDNKETDKANNILNNTIKPIENGYQSYKDSFSRKSNTVQKVKDKVNDAMSKFNDADEKYTDHLNKYKINSDVLSDIHKKNKYKRHLYTLEPVGMGVSDVTQARERTNAIVKGLGAPFRAISRLLGFKKQEKVNEQIELMLNFLDEQYLEEKRRRPGAGGNNQQQNQNRGQHNQQQKQDSGPYADEKRLFRGLKALHYYHHHVEGNSSKAEYAHKMMNDFKDGVEALHHAEAFNHKGKHKLSSDMKKLSADIMSEVRQKYHNHLKENNINEKEMHDSVRRHKQAYDYDKGIGSIMKEHIVKDIEHKNFVKAKESIHEALNEKVINFIKESTKHVVDEKYNKKRKPDYLDFDGDGNEKESMKKALKDKMMKNESNDPIGSLIKILNRGDLNPGAPKTTPPTPTKKPLSVKMKSVATTNKPKKLRQPDPKDYDKALY